MAEENKRLGIIGGMGPKATAVFMDKIIEHTVADRDQEHIDMIVLNHATLPDRTSVILENNGGLFLQAIERDFRLLEAAGAANIAIPCNTSHYFYDELQAMTGIPIIHMVEETIREMADRHGAGSRIGLLATNGTLRSGIYKKACDKYGLELHTPHDSVQARVMRMIYHDIKAGQHISSEEIEGIIMDLVVRERCSGVMIACTELSCIPMSEATKPYRLDAMDVLVRKSIELSGKRWKGLS